MVSSYFRETDIFAPENGCLEDECFLLGWPILPIFLVLLGHMTWLKKTTILDPPGDGSGGKTNHPKNWQSFGVLVKYTWFV